MDPSMPAAGGWCQRSTRYSSPWSRSTGAHPGRTPSSQVTSFFFFQAEDGIRDRNVTGVQTCALLISFMTPMQCQFLDWRLRMKVGSRAQGTIKVLSLPDRLPKSGRASTDRDQRDTFVLFVPRDAHGAWIEHRPAIH